MPAPAGGGLVRRGLAWAVVATLTTAALLMATARPAMAHATLLSTTPTADELLSRGPDDVELVFDEPVEVVDGAVRVFGPSGERVDRGQVEIDDTTLRAPIDSDAQGTYTVAWRVLSGDSHNLEGSFVFHVGTKTGAIDIADADDPPTEVAGTLGRLLAIAGTLLLFGAGFMRLLNGPEQAVADRLRLLAMGGAGTGVFGTVLILVARAAESSGRPLLEAISLVPDLATDTRTGRLSAARGLILALGLIAAAHRPTWSRAPWLAIATATIAMALTSSSGHAWTADQRLVALGADLGHQVAVGIWVGGAVGLLVALRATAARSRLARRFSAAALVSAVVVAVTGTVSAFIQLGSWDALTSTGYGQLVAVKVAGFVILVTFGWMNRRHLVPIVERAASPLLRSLRWEVLVAVGVLAVTAVLVDQPPGRTSVDQPYNASVTVEGATVQLTVTPARTGPNDMHLYFYDASTGEALAVDAVEVMAATAELPPRRLDVIPVTASHVSVLGVSFTAPGELDGRGHRSSEPALPPPSPSRFRSDDPLHCYQGSRRARRAPPRPPRRARRRPRVCPRRRGRPRRRIPRSRHRSHRAVRDPADLGERRPCRGGRHHHRHSHRPGRHAPDTRPHGAGRPGRSLLGHRRVPDGRELDRAVHRRDPYGDDGGCGGGRRTDHHDHFDVHDDDHGGGHAGRPNRPARTTTRAMGAVSASVAFLLRCSSDS